MSMSASARIGVLLGVSLLAMALGAPTHGSGPPYPLSSKLVVR